MPYDIHSRAVVRAAFTVAVCTAMAGCGARKAGATTASEAAPCAITLTGAQSGTLSCSDDLTGIYGIKEKVTMVGFTSSDTMPQVMITIRIPGEPATKTYRNSDAGVTQGIMIRSGKLMWLAQAGTDHVGSYLLTLTSVKETPLATDAKGYEVHGTITATLQPDLDTGAKGSITLNAKF